MDLLKGPCAQTANDPGDALEPEASTMIRLIAGTLALVSSPAFAAPSTFEQVVDGVYCVRDDAGQWSGDMSKAIAHQNSENYLTKKVLDLSEVTDEIWARATQVRVSAYLLVSDYSWNVGDGERNGLDESFVMIVNGTEHEYPTSCGAPAWPISGTPIWGWYDFIIPQSELTRGENEIIFHKTESEKNDDYLYICIDTTVEPANSYVDLGNGEWTQEKLTVPGGNGEYMVRVYLITEKLGFQTVWDPSAAMDDAAGLVLYAGSQYGQEVTEGLALETGQTARLEWRGDRIDQMTELTALAEATGEIECAWLDSDGAEGDYVRGPASYFADLPASRALMPTGFVVRPADAPVTLKKLTLTGALSHRPADELVDMAPVIHDPPAGPADRRPECVIGTDEITLANREIECRFDTSGGRLRLTSLHHERADSEMVRHPGDVALFLVEVDGERYAGSRDFRLADAQPAENGFEATLVRDEIGMEAELRAWVDGDSLRMAFGLTNVGDQPVEFKLAFPHMAGLAISETPADDYYFYPWGGGIISDRPASIRRGYGDHEALYQMMDIFSPERGAGLMLRVDDEEGWHKILALRKHVPGKAAFGGEKMAGHIAAEMKWSDTLPEVEGTGLAVEYLRRTRGPGKSFSVPDAVITPHAGGWKAAMGAYARWAHDAWQFRKHPSALGPITTMIAAGWAQSVLFKDGAYRTDIIKPMTDCIELMSWWDWSPLGPWGTPIDEYREKFGEAKWKQWKPYFVEDPVTGEMMWNNQPGGYDGYNERFGGLESFREAIEMYQGMGLLTTLYTDPFRMDEGCEVGRAHGKEWGVVTAEGEHSKGYDVYNPCHDNPDVREWVADAMERVMRETGADGIRLDEYGHRGFVCYSDEHAHSYAEPGATQWQKATTEATRMVRERMDMVNPESVLTTEHPGYDYMMAAIDGCITYDLTVQSTELRPVEVNTQRFYFPECKAYELDHRGADPTMRKRFWNAVASFGARYPKPMYNVLRENRDVFETGQATPLLRTLVERVYANRFEGRGKTFTMLRNATGHTVDGALLQLDLAPGSHAVDVLACREVAGSEANLYLAPDDVACIARLPKRLTARLDGDALAARVKGRRAGCSVTLVSMDGETLVEEALGGSTVTFDLSTIHGEPALVKLMRGGQLIDMVEVPRD